MMTDYPTRAEIDAAANTIEALQTYVDRGVPAWGVTWSGLETAREILTHLDAVGGVLHYPEPEPTAAEVLREAYMRATNGTPEELILIAAKLYATDQPEWFADWYEYKDANVSLAAAAQGAVLSAENYAAFNLLNAAAEVAEAHPELFGGDA